MIASPSTLRPLALDRRILRVCANDDDEVAWVEQIERRFVVMRARYDRSPKKVAELATLPSLAFVGRALYVATVDGVARIERGHATPVHVFDERPSEVILKGTATLLALVAQGAGGSWDIWELGERARPVGTYETRPLAVSTHGTVWVAALHDESVAPIDVRSARLPEGATGAIHRGTWRLESDVASGPEVECGPVRTLVALGELDERVPRARGGVLFVERTADGDRIGELWPDGSDFRYDARARFITNLAPFGDGMCWSEGHRVWRIDSDSEDPRPLLDVEPDVVVQGLHAAGRSLLVVSSAGIGAPTSLRWHDRA